MIENLGEAVLKVFADVSQLAAGLGKGTALIKTFSNNIRNAGRSISSFGKQLGVFSATLALLFAPAIVAGAKFQKTMAGVKAVVSDLKDGTEEAVARFDELNTKAKELGASTKFSASQVAQAMQFLGMAGFTTQQILTGVDQTLTLAAAGGLDLAKAADISSDAMTAFKLAAADLGRVVDAMAVTASAANTNIEMLGEAFRYVAPAASAFGHNVEEVSVALGLLANAGIKASSAGAGLAQVYNRLASGQQVVTDTLAKYGIALEEVNPSVHGLMEIVQRLRDAGVSAGDMLSMFGARAGRIALTLANTTTEAVESLTDAMANKFGTALEQAAIKAENVAGQFTGIMSRMEGISIAIFEAIQESLSQYLYWISEALEGMLAWVEENENLVGTLGTIAMALAGVTGALAAVLVPLGVFMAAIAGIAAGVAALGGAIPVIATVVGTLGGMAAISPIIYALVRNFEQLKNAVLSFYASAIRPLLDAFVQGLSDSINGHVKPALDRFADAVKEFLKDVQQWVEDNDHLVASLETLVELLGRLTGAIAAVGINGLARQIENPYSTPSILKLIASTSLTFKLADAALRLARALGLLGDEAEEVVEKLEEENEVSSESIKISNDRYNQLKRNVGLDQELIRLRERQGELNAKELKDLAELLDEREGSLEVMRDSVNALEEEVEKYDDKIAAMEREGKNADDLKLKRRGLVLALQTAENTLLRNIDALAELGEEAIVAGDKARELASDLAEEEKQLNAVNEATKRATSLTEKLTNASEELSASLKGSLQRELDDLRAAREEQEAYYRERQEGIRKQMELELERRNMKAFAKLGLESHKLREQREKDLEKFQEKRSRLLEKAEYEARDHLRQLEVEQLKSQDRLVEAAKLENERIREQKQRQYDDLFEIEEIATEKQLELRRRAEALDEKAAERRIQKAKEAEEKAREARLKKTDDSGKIQESVDRQDRIQDSIAGKLVEQASSVAQLVRAYQIIETLRAQQDKSALAAGRGAARAEFAIGRLGERLAEAEGSGDDRLQRRIRLQLAMKQEEAAILRGRARREAQMAGVGVDEGGALGQLDDRVKITTEAVARTIRGVTAVFADAPRRWSSAFVSEWDTHSKRMIAAVAATMAEIKRLQHPATKSSPSLADIWNQNVQTVAKGVNAMGENIKKIAPDMHGLKAGNLVSPVPVPISAGGASPGGMRGGELHDNRRVDMVVNNNVDLQELQRHVGNALVGAFNQRGEI